jgi:predicted SAM-dependent methyltransferase
MDVGEVARLEKSRRVFILRHYVSVDIKRARIRRTFTNCKIDAIRSTLVGAVELLERVTQARFNQVILRLSGWLKAAMPAHTHGDVGTAMANLERL